MQYSKKLSWKHGHVVAALLSRVQLWHFYLWVPCSRAPPLLPCWETLLSRCWWVAPQFSPGWRAWICRGRRWSCWRQTLAASPQTCQFFPSPVSRKVFFPALRIRIKICIQIRPFVFQKIGSEKYKKVIKIRAGRFVVYFKFLKFFFN